MDRSLGESIYDARRILEVHKKKEVQKGPQFCCLQEEMNEKIGRREDERIPVQ